MKHFVRLSVRAERDVASVLAWFYDHNALTAGRRWFQEYMTKIDTLEFFPDRCPIAAEADEIGIELRELHCGRRPHVYRILFVINDRDVHILRVRHCARDSLLPEDLK